MIFKTAQECLTDMDQRIRYSNPWHAEMDAKRRKKDGQKQLRCEACRRWKWPDERCNFFSEQPLRQPEKDHP